MPAWDKIPKISKYKIPEVAQYLRDLITEIVLYSAMQRQEASYGSPQPTILLVVDRARYNGPAQALAKLARSDLPNTHAVLPHSMRVGRS